MTSNKATDISAVFAIDNATVEETLRWANDVAHLDVTHLRSTLVAGGKLCDICLSLSTYYEENLQTCRQLINEGKGDPVINQKRLPLLERGMDINNLVGYLTLLQMDATMSVINLMEAQTDSERLLFCKHACTILSDAYDKGLYKIISKDMFSLPDEILPKDACVSLWASVKEVKSEMMTQEEVNTIRNTIDAHKSSSFKEQIDIYRQCNFGKCFASIYALMKISWTMQEAMSIARRNLSALEGDYYKELNERLKKWDDLKAQLEGADV